MPLAGLINRLQPLARMAGAGLLDVLYPLECVGCGSSGGVICPSCASDLPQLQPPFCRVCAAPGDFSLCSNCVATPRHFNGIRAPFLYADDIRRAILALKYGGIRAAANQLADLMSDYYRRNPLPCDMVAAVPMHPSRLRERGYNQADLLARRVARQCRLTYDPQLLQRSRQVAPQAGIANAAQRASNVANSIRLNPSASVRDAQILLIDDVATTGSTLDAGAAILKDAGAATVWCLTLAVVPQHSFRE